MSTHIAEGNKMIAEFMGATHVIDGDVMWNKKLQFYNGLYVCPRNELLYHFSWDWLYPTIQKIAKWMLYTEFGTHEKLNEAIKATAPIFQSLEKVKPIEEVFPVVVQFIQWYTSLTPINKP